MAVVSAIFICVDVSTERQAGVATGQSHSFRCFRPVDPLLTNAGREAAQQRRLGEKAIVGGFTSGIKSKSEVETPRFSTFGDPVSDAATPPQPGHPSIAVTCSTAELLHLLHLPVQPSPFIAPPRDPQRALSPTSRQCARSGCWPHAAMSIHNLWLQLATP